ncbi:uncharacterized protein V6R79_019914 [Siganus canaliculatus]
MENRKSLFPDVNGQTVPDALLFNLAATVCNGSTLTAHHRHCKGCEIRRPDAVWHHPHGRNKYKYFLEQPVSVTGAGRDISFLCDAVAGQRKKTPLPPLSSRSSTDDTQNLSICENVIPEEYHIVRNKGLESLELYEDAFTVQLHDCKKKLRPFPSLRPSGRLEVIQLMRVMDDMLMQTGVDQQPEELTELSQMEGLLELVQEEQNIYNIIFYEVIRQVSVNCTERGQLLAKLRQRYQSLLERIPHRLKALHTEVVAQRALDRRLTEEIIRIKAAMERLSLELSRIREHDTLVSQQVEDAQQQLAGTLQQTHTDSEVVQSYHELYELHRDRLKAQLLQMTEERDSWSQLALCLALKVIDTRKLQLINRLHNAEQGWSQTAEHCSLYLSSQDTTELNVIMELAGYWKQLLTPFVSQLKETEHAQYEQLTVIHQGITKWLDLCSTNNKSPDPRYDEASLEQLHTDLKQWSNMLALQYERYQGEKPLRCQETLRELGHTQDSWLSMSLKLFRRHRPPDEDPPADRLVLTKLERTLSELLKQLDAQVSGETGILEQMTSLLGLMDSWISKLGAAIGQTKTMPISEWMKLEKVLQNCQSLAEKALQCVSYTQMETGDGQNGPDTHAKTEKVIEQVQEFQTRLSNFTDGENQRLSEEIASIHKALTHWMMHLLLLTVPDNNLDPNQKHEYGCTANISLHTLDEEAKMLAKKLDYFSKYITGTCKLILEEKILLNPHDAKGKNEMIECNKLQTECIEWVETSKSLLSGVSSPGETDPAPCSDVLVTAADSTEALVNEGVSAQCTSDSDVNDHTQPEQSEEALALCENPVVRLIGHDGGIAERKLGESCVHLSGTEEVAASPVKDEAQKAFSDLTTVGFLQQELYDSELRVQSTEQRALKAEEALQAALDKIQELERQLQSRPSPEPKSSEEKQKTPPPPVTPASPPKKTTEANPASSSKRTKKC